MKDSPAASEHSWEMPVFEFSGGEPCLDFANTINSRSGLAGADKLSGYRDLLAWGVQAGILSANAADELEELAECSPEKAAKVFSSALRIREVIYRLFSAAAAGRPSSPADLDILNPALKKALPHARVVASEHDCQWGWCDDLVLDRVLWPVVGSAGQLLTGPARDHVGECGGRDCTWLFLDTSRNRKRRWCDMKSCGNREKARRHYERARASSA